MNNASSKNSNCNTCSAELIVLVTIKVVIALLCLLRRHRAKRPSTHVERHRRAADALRLQAAQKLVGKVKPRRGRRHTTLLAQLSLGVGIKMGLQHLKSTQVKAGHRRRLLWRRRFGSPVKLLPTQFRHSTGKPQACRQLNPRP